MCERCDKSNARLEHHRDKIEEIIADCTRRLQGNFNAEELAAMDFPEDKPFMQKLWVAGTVALQMALVSAIITGEPPSMVMGEWAGVALETEMEQGNLGGLLEMLSAAMGGVPPQSMN